MPDRLITLLSSRTALILAGNSVGTGSFIAPGRILTCAHVVRSAHEKGESITVQYNLSAHGAENINSAEVLDLFVSDETDGQEYPDVAVLKINDFDHPVLQLPRSDEEVLYHNTREYLAIGFQKTDRQSGRNIPQSVSLNYEGEEDAGYMRKIQFENGLVRPGMSGAPLVEREGGIITGIVQKTRNPNDDIGAYTIPVEVIWDELKKGDPGLYSLLNSNAYRRKIRREYRAAYPKYPLLKKYGIKLFILPVLLFLGMWWIFYHVGPIQESVVVATLLISLTFSGKLLSDWLGESVRSESSKVKSNVARLLFSPALLSLLGVIVVSLWLFVSSIWIYASPAEANFAVTLHADKTDTATINTRGTARFLTAFIPFADSVDLRLKGSQTRAPRVKFNRNEFFYPKDFSLEPVLILRFDHNYLHHLDKYILHILAEPSGQELTDSALQSSGSILVGGRELVIGENKENEWHRELVGLDPVHAKKIINKWKEVKHHKIDLAVHDRIVVTLTDKSDSSEVKRETYLLHDDETDIYFKIF